MVPISTAALAFGAFAVTINDVCTTSYVQASLPADGFVRGLTFDSTSVTASPVFNASVSGAEMFPDATFDFCNVTFAYTHDGTSDTVHLNYWLPAPANFKNRYLSTGGGGLAINSGTTTSGSLPGGVQYGAVSGLTDGGFGSFTTQFDAVTLLANGTLNWPATYMFGYQAHHELALIGKEFTKTFFNMSSDSIPSTNSSTSLSKRANSTSTKLYSYYQGCSEGGREGWSQVQRFADQFDGAVIGAPAFRYGQQQVNHLFSNVVEQTLGYFPPPCEFEAIVNATIAACDGMDGQADGVVARTDLCKINYNPNVTIGTPYYCAAVTASVGGFGKRQFDAPAATPEQNGTVTAKGVEVAMTIIDGLKTLDGKQAYLSYQPTASFEDAGTAFDSETNTWGLSISGLGGEWVTRYLDLIDTSDLTSLSGVTYDTLRDWMYSGWQRYEDVLQTTWPDLSAFHTAGGKILHYHGESDNSIPAASSVRYHDSVRQIMYPDLTYNESVAALNDWYRLYLVPGAAHCSPDAAQPNGPFPQTNLAVVIEWVENGVVPVTLNATHLTGESVGSNAQICAWPLRPLWGNGTMGCEYDQSSIDSWLYTLDAWPKPLY
ncbi:hypothetical protein IFR05_005330 [Cadophora sp. M221]|nr:hypothetical protein IFR05_005330 [Cadophora sp. M221]